MKKIVLLMLIGIISFAFAEEKGNTVKLTVNGMTCSSCVNTVEKALKGVNGVFEAKVNLKEKSATVVLASNSKITQDELIKAVADAGFSASENKAESKSMKKADDCEGGCCADDCDSSSKEMKTKKSKAKTPAKKS